MAMFLNGWEESPNQYTGWTLSGIAQCGHHLYLSGGGQDTLASTAAWTLRNGSLPTVESNRFKYTTRSDIKTTSNLPNGNFDLRFDWDSVIAPTDAGAASNVVSHCMALDYAGANFILLQLTSPSFSATLQSSTGNASGVAIGGLRHGTLRLNRTGNVFTGYLLNPFTNAWTNLGTLTKAFATLATDIVIGTISTSTTVGKGYNQYLRNVVPTVTTGTATSPVMDTVDGLRGIGWFVDSGGTGTVLMEYRFGQTSGACSAASYQTATSFLPIVPSAGNRYVQVRLTISGGSTTLPSPEVGPILVNGSIDQATTSLLFKRLVTSFTRHSNTLYQVCMDEQQIYKTCVWSRAALGVGRWVTANNRNLTFEGTTWDLGDYAVQGLVNSITGPNGYLGTNQVQVEAAYTLLPGLVAGWSVFGSILTSQQKTDLTSSINTWISQHPALNWNGFAITNRLAMTALWNLDGSHTSGQWDSTVAGVPYTDADCATYVTNLSNGYIGQGAFNDQPGHNDDTYSVAIGLQNGLILGIKPTFTSAATLIDWLQQVDRTFRQICTPEGVGSLHGRSVGGDDAVGQAQLNFSCAETASGRYDTARELLTNGVWYLLRYCFQFGPDFFTFTLTRQSNVLSIEGYGSNALSNGEMISAFGMFATNSALYTLPPSSYPGEEAGAAIWVGPTTGIAYGGGVNDPQLQSHGTSYDAGGGSGYQSKYPMRIGADHFGQNTGIGSDNAPCPQNGFFYYTDSSLSAGNKCSLQKPTTAEAIHTGRGVVIWRSGTPWQFSATVSTGTNAAGVTATEATYLRGHHAVAVAKVALVADGRTMSNFGFASPPIPLANGDSLNNTATTTAYAYAEAPATYQEILSVIVTGITSNMQGAGVPRTGTAFLLAANQINRMNYGGAGVDLLNASATPSGTVYAAADFAFSHAAMTAATETAYVGSFSQVGDVITFTFDANAVVASENVYIGMSAQNLSGQAIGSYSVTGSAVKAFVGKSSAADWWGGGDLTSVSFSSVLQATLGTAGNLSIYKISSTTTQVRADQGDVTLYAACLPTNFALVYAYDVFDSLIDITSLCTVTSGVSVVIPSGVVTTYSFGIARFNVTTLPPATAFLLSGPSQGPIGVPSTPFTLIPDGPLASGEVVTLSDNAAGGTFTPSTLTFLIGSSTGQTFTYTPAVLGTISILTSPSPTLGTPPSATYTSTGLPLSIVPIPVQFNYVQTTEVKFNFVQAQSPEFARK